MIKNPYYITGFCFCLLVFSTESKAQPSLLSSQDIAGQRIFRDIKLANVFYYTPLDYKLVNEASGKPEFTLIQMRYTGTRAAGDAGAAKYNNLLQFHVAVDQSVQKKLVDVKTALRKIYPAAELRVLPVKKFSSVLVFAGTEDTGIGDSVHLMKTSYTEATDENASSNNSYWNDRIVSLRLNNNDAQIAESALRNHQSVMSFSYAIYSIFAEKDIAEVNISGSGTLVKQAKDFFDHDIMNSKDSALHILMVKANAINMIVNVDDWPSLIQKVDINERVPAKYALFDVYCYDFNNELRPDLYAKKIEIKATSVNGSEIMTTYSFKGSQPDLYAKSIRFSYAVRFDKPFYYRVTEINGDGDTSATEWKERKGWSEILDITSTPDKVIVKPKDTDQ